MYFVESFGLVAFEILNIILLKSVENGKKVLKQVYTEILGLVLLVLIIPFEDLKFFDVHTRWKGIYSCTCSHSSCKCIQGIFRWLCSKIKQSYVKKIVCIKYMCLTS